VFFVVAVVASVRIQALTWAADQIPQSPSAGERCISIGHRRRCPALLIIVINKGRSIPNSAHAWIHCIALRHCPIGPLSLDALELEVQLVQRTYHGISSIIHSRKKTGPKPTPPLLSASRAQARVAAAVRRCRGCGRVVNSSSNNTGHPTAGNPCLKMLRSAGGDQTTVLVYITAFLYPGF
jgi:hypothetical protein